MSVMNLLENPAPARTIVLAPRADHIEPPLRLRGIREFQVAASSGASTNVRGGQTADDGRQVSDESLSVPAVRIRKPAVDALSESWARRRRSSATLPMVVSGRSCACSAEGE